MSDQIKVFAPATVANVACGFDIMGFALNTWGDVIEVKKTNSPGLVIKEIKGGPGIPLDALDNVATVAVQSLLDTLDINVGFEFCIEKKINAGSGLGSSASSSAGAVFAVNELLGRPLSRKELVIFAMEGEKLASGKAHADNVAPCLMGGFTAVTSYDPLSVISIPFPEDLIAVLVYPQIEIKTADAKRILRKEIKLEKAITQGGNLVGLTTGLITKNYELIGDSLHDAIAEPVRSMLIPMYMEAKDAALSAGALGFNISGSGPSLFALCKDANDAKKVEKAVLKIYANEGIATKSLISKINPTGAEVI